MPLSNGSGDDQRGPRFLRRQRWTKVSLRPPSDGTVSMTGHVSKYLNNLLCWHIYWLQPQSAPETILFAPRLTSLWLDAHGISVCMGEERHVCWNHDRRVFILKRMQDLENNKKRISKGTTPPFSDWGPLIVRRPTVNNTKVARAVSLLIL